MSRERTAFPIALDVPSGKGAAGFLHARLREAILAGRLAVGFRLPPTRELARSVGLARGTVVVAYDMLAAEGYIRVRQGDGTFVHSMRRAISHNDERVSFSPRTGLHWKPDFDLRLGYPDISSFPFEVWRRMASRAWRAVAVADQALLDPAGVIELREAIVGHASYARAVSCKLDDIVITAGAQQAFDLLARTLIRVPGTIVAVEDPCYTPMRQAFENAGASVIGVGVDQYGLDVARVPAAAKVICVTPSHQFPLGLAMSPERRMQLLDQARRHGAMIVEDDYDCEYRYDGRPLDALQTLAPEQVCYVGTFSKTMFAALRLGYAVIPQSLRNDLLSIRKVADGFCAPVPQLALASFIREGHLHRHIRRMQRTYADRRIKLVDGLRLRLGDRIETIPSTAGLHFSFRLVEPGKLDLALRKALKRKVAFELCSRYSVGGFSGDCCAIGFGSLPDDLVEPCLNHLSSIFE